MHRNWFGRKTAVLLPICLSALFAWLILSPLQVFAATIAVTTTTDETDGCGVGTGCSIREAIADAVNGDDVDIPAGTYVLTLGQITVTKDITLTGSSAASTIIDANGASRVFSVTNGATVVFQDMTITGGNTGTGIGNNGGGILIQVADVVLNDVIVDGNQADQGGGIMLQQGGLTVNRGEIINNVATSSSSPIAGGGGVSIGYNDDDNGTPVITDLTAVFNDVLIQGNSVPDRNRAGGLMQQAGLTTLNNTLILSNTSRYGGGIYLAGGTLNQNGGEIAYNEVDVRQTGSVQFGGGGIYMVGGILNSTNGEIHNNVSNADGGGIHIGAGEAYLDGVEMYDNTTAQFGGAIHVQRTQAELFVTNSYFHGNVPDAISIDTVRNAQDNVRTYGSTFDDHTTVFNFIDDGELIAFANNITNYTVGISGTNVITTGLNYNWWGSGATPTDVNQTEAFEHRLGAPVAGAVNNLAWSATGSLVDTGNGRNATLTDAGGSGGTGVIVSHGRGVSNTPFGAGVAPFANQMCSDFFTMFEVEGENPSTWDVTVPVDNTVDCNANAAGGTAMTNLLIDFATDGSAASDTGCAGSGCWDLAPSISRIGASAPFSLQSSGVASANMGVAFVVSSDDGTDPTAILLLDGSASSTQLTWLVLGMMLLMLGGTAVLLQQRAQAKPVPIRVK